jgi:hypothetical protein
VYFGIFMVESLQVGHVARLFLVNVSENLQFFFLWMVLVSFTLHLLRL